MTVEGRGVLWLGSRFFALCSFSGARVEPGGLNHVVKKIWGDNHVKLPMLGWLWAPKLLDVTGGEYIVLNDWGTTGRIIKA